MTWLSAQSDFSSLACRCYVVMGAMYLAPFLGVVAADPVQERRLDVELLTGKQAQESLDRKRSATLQAVPLLDAISDLQASLQYAIILDHRIDPDQPITLATGMVDSREVLRGIAQAAGADVAFADRFAVVGPPASVDRLRTVLEIRRSEVRALRKKLSSQVYGLWFDDVGAGWPSLMQPDYFVTQQIQMAGMTRQSGFELPYDAWRSQQLPGLDLVERLTVVLNQFGRTFQVAENGTVSIMPVEENPTVRRRVRIPTDRRSAVESFLQNQDPAVAASWSGNRVTLQGRIELIESVERIVRDQEAGAQKEGLKTQLFTMSIPAGSTIGQVVESLKVSGISIRIEGLNSQQLEGYLQTEVQLDARRMPGSEFFSALLQVDGGAVQVRKTDVLVQF